MHQNMEAFLAMLAWSEIGPELLAESKNGFDIIVGSRPGRIIKFRDFSDHPRVVVQLNSKLWSSAAGRYQILQRTFDEYKAKLNLHDFSPESQDKIAERLIIDCGAESEIKEGKIQEAIAKVKHVWASLPESPHGQPTHRIEPLLIAYRNAGGTIA